MPETYTVRGEGQTVELVLHRRHGARGRTLIAETLRINPGLAALGAWLPPGTQFLLPDLPAETATVRPRKSLFKD
ncbi:tail protein X [Rhizobium straminoryzae]|uniref:Phage tail protein n=1 Tax=Rhizobium straminoryzae TaxID=1387186 RepID=A0A549T0S6_9HYPH|nr:tail protein X [Rhizobium straminoryzae]TRL35483.1 phage tail protein [Rhizobium straminoryzae]